VVILILCLLTNDNNDYPIILQPHIVFTDGKQRQPNHNMTTYCVYWRYYDWVNCCCRPSVNTICGRIVIGLSLLSSRQQRQPNHNTTTYCVYWRTTTTLNPIIIRRHIVFTDGPVGKHNMWSYYDWFSLLSSVSKHTI
jgi:hypothetical protein